jgi:hypothetical protein
VNTSSRLAAVLLQASNFSLNKEGERRLDVMNGWHSVGGVEGRFVERRCWSERMSDFNIATDSFL